MQVDLQLSEISPVRPKIKTGSQTTVKVVLKNNTGSIEKGHARCHLTLSKEFLYKPSGFKSKTWASDIIKTESNYEMYFRNKTVMVPGGILAASFSFTVRGKKAGKADITGVSTLSADATESDHDGNNQSASAEIIVTKRTPSLPD